VKLFQLLPLFVLAVLRKEVLRGPAGMRPDELPEEIQKKKEKRIN
jgi:hypothetical protein